MSVFKALIASVLLIAPVHAQDNAIIQLQRALTSGDRVQYPLTYSSLDELLKYTAFEKCVADGGYDDLELGIRNPVLAYCAGKVEGRWIGFSQGFCTLKAYLEDFSMEPCFDESHYHKLQEFTVKDREDRFNQAIEALDPIGELDLPYRSIPVPAPGSAMALGNLWGKNFPPH